MATSILERVPEGYRIVVGSFMGSIPRVKLQKKGWFFWSTVDSMIVVGELHGQDTKADIEWAAAKMIARESDRVQSMNDLIDLRGIYASQPEAQNQNV